MHHSVPKYIQLIERIKEDIQRQALVSGEQLPNEDKLAAQYNMSRGTVRKAIGELQRMGLVRKEQGRGTFVNETKPVLSGFSLVEFDHYVRTQGHIPSTRTLIYETIASTNEISEKLAIEPQEPVLHIVQTRLADDKPIVYEERFFARRLCPDMTRSAVEESSIHWLLVEAYQIPLIRMAHTIEVARLPDDKFDVFKVNEAIPVFHVDRLSFTQIEGEVQPFVWYQAYYRSDDYRFEAQFLSSV